MQIYYISICGLPENIGPRGWKFSES